MIEDVLLTPLKIINTEGGDVLHAMKNSDKGFSGFGEAYFSEVQQGAVKGWKRHTKMTLNLVVPAGEIRFVIFDDRNKGDEKFQEIILSRNNYYRLTVPPMVWMAFQGIGENISILLNIADIPHVPTEADKKDLDKIQYNWGI